MKLTHGAGHHASPECQRPHETMYCDEAGVVITEQCIQVHGAWHPIAELTDIGVARGAAGPAALVCVASGATAAIIGEANRVLDPTGHGSLVAALVAALAAVVAAALALGGLLAFLNRPQELWARCRGEWVLLFATRDKIEFGKVRRALQRAILARAARVGKPDPVASRRG